MDAETVAKGLSEAQRRLVIEGGDCVRSYKPAQKLVTLGIWADSGDDFTIHADWTPLGVAVRALLEGE